ncbi:MAG: Polymyxin resistance protein ArnT, partial [Verrucomicrobiales bacterium]|nr:Polymyxin resistance protein ArnT [Verrucomicrobiales bacterium]
MRRVFPLLLVVLTWAVIYLPGLGGMELKGEEGRRILPARTMMRTGDYVLPWSEGKPYHRKPPLVNWSIAASFRAMGGESEFAARLPSALAVLLLALTAVRAGRILAGPAGAWWLPIAILTTIGAVEKGRLAEIESLFFSLSGIGMLVWLGGWHRGGSPWSRWLLAGFWFGLASLAKGPVFLPFFYAIAVVALWKNRQWRELLHPAHFVGLAISLFLPLPWVMASRARLALLPADPSATGQTQMWLNQITKRLDPSVIDWKTYPLGPFETLLLLCPWALAAMVLWKKARRDWLPRLPMKDGALILGLGWGSLASGLVYALLPESHARFQLPLIAPVATLAVVLLTHWKNFRDPGLEEPATAKWVSGIMRFLLLIIPVTGVIATALKAPGNMLLAMGVMVGGSLPLWLLAIRAARMAWPDRLFAESALLCTGIIALKASVIMPIMRLHEDIRPPALQMLALTGPEPRLLAMYPGPQPFLFYLGKNVVEISSSRQITPDATHLVIPAKRLESKEMSDRLARAGFAEILLTVPDDDGTPYTLLRRSSAPDATTQDAPHPPPPP